MKITRKDFLKTLAAVPFLSLTKMLPPIDDDGWTHIIGDFTDPSKLYINGNLVIDSALSLLQL